MKSSKATPFVYRLYTEPFFKTVSVTEVVVEKETDVFYYTDGFRIGPSEIRKDNIKVIDKNMLSGGYFVLLDEEEDIEEFKGKIILKIMADLEAEIEVKSNELNEWGIYLCK